MLNKHPEFDSRPHIYWDGGLSLKPSYWRTRKLGLNYNLIELEMASWSLKQSMVWSVRSNWF